MFTSQDHHIVITALRDLLVEFPPTSEPSAISARQQARMILKKYESTLTQLPADDTAHHIEP